jgi:hypothetical protein
MEESRCCQGTDNGEEKMIVHIKSTTNVDDSLISTLMEVLRAEGYEVEKYLGINSKIVMARKFEKSEGRK